MFWNKEKFPQHIFNTLNNSLVAKSKGLFKLHAGRCHVLPHVYTMLIDDAPEAKMDQAINLADDLQNSLAKIGIFQNVTVRPFPLRVEVDRKDPASIPLSKYWPKMLHLSVDDGGFAPAVIYRGGKEILVDLALSSQQNSHVGIFGTTGSGKTVMAMSALLTLAYRNNPNTMGMVLCDPTGKNFKPLAGLPHLMTHIAVKPEDVRAAVRSVKLEMERRAEHDSDDSYRIVLVIDEFSDRLDQDEQIAEDVQALIQKARNFNINLIMLAQKMTVSVPTVISNNIGCRIVGRIADKADAKRTGGENCLAHRLPAGRGAFELHNGIHSVRVQGLYVNPADIPQMIGDICQRWTGQRAKALDIVAQSQPIGDTTTIVSRKNDPLFIQKVKSEGVTKPGEVRRIYQELFGKQLAHYDAIAVLNGLQ